MTMKLIRPVSIGKDETLLDMGRGTYFDKNGVMQKVPAGGFSVTPRLDYDPTDLSKAPRILIESATTNLVTGAELLTTGWTQTASTYAVDTTQSDLKGNLTLPRLSETIDPQEHTLSQLVTKSSAAKINYYASVFAKLAPDSPSRVSFTLALYGGAMSGGKASVSFNLSDQTYIITPSVGGSVAFSTPINANIQYYGNGFYRCSFSAISNSDPQMTVAIILENALRQTPYIGNPLFGMFFWGAQLEENQITSYTAGTRALDILNYDTYSNVPETIPYYNVANQVVYPTGSVAVGTDKYIYQSITGSTNNNITLTIASPCVATWNAHGFADGTPITFIHNTDALPTGLSYSVVYFIKAPTTNTFNLAATVGGAAINTTGTQSGTHTANASTNYLIDPLVNTGGVWLKTVAENKWAMFDSVISNQTTNTDVIATLIKVKKAGGISSIADSVGLLNIDCASVRIVAYDSYTDSNGLTTITSVYDQAFTGSEVSGITDLYTFFFEQINRVENIVATDLPNYANCIVSVCLANTGQTVKCGELVIGQKKDLGALQAGTEVSIQDFSVKTQDAFGNYVVLQRAFSNKATFAVWIDSTQTDLIKKLLANYRSIPILYVGNNDYGSTFVYGFYKDFSIIFQQTSVSLCNIQLEGLI